MTPIEAINNVAKAYQDLAVVLMAVADKTIGVPVAQAMAVDADKPAEEPKKEAPKVAKAKAEKPAKEPEEVITIEQVRAVLAEKSQAGFTAQVKALLESFDANKLSAVKPEDYADHNPQMMLYALGALNLFDCLYDIEQVTMTIFQPRLSSISTWTISAEELYKWAEEVLRPKAELAAKGEGEFISGSWCRFCKARNTCRARAESFLELAKMEFQPPALLSDEEVAEVMEKADELSKWASDVMAYAQAEAIENGKHWNGYKLVEGRSTRRFIDEKKVEEAAKGAGYTDIYNKSLITLTAFEKLMGKDTFKEVLGSYVTKPAGKLTLVPVSDKRPEVTVNTVNDEF